MNKFNEEKMHIFLYPNLSDNIPIIGTVKIVIRLEIPIKIPVNSWLKCIDPIAKNGIIKLNPSNKKTIKKLDIRAKDIFLFLKIEKSIVGFLLFFS